MRPDQFEFMRGFLKERSGLTLGDDKSYLLESRLTPVARKQGFKDLEELIDKVKSGNDAVLASSVTEAMTTNESFFFRDQKPFDLFRDTVIPHILETRAEGKSFRVWSAAASSGQEPYSIGMILREQAMKFSGWSYDIVGTDLSSEIINKAKNGLYSQFEVQRGMPIQLLVKYFDKAGDQWQIKTDLQSMVQFKVYNLLHDLSSLGKFDVVFCRNVLIYFDQPTKKMVLENMAALMPNDGFLFLGGAETVLGITDRFAPVPGLRGIYKKTG
jgi:chemotaxis protein methyltransferase CheR